MAYQHRRRFFWLCLILALLINFLLVLIISLRTGQHTAADQETAEHTPPPVKFINEEEPVPAPGAAQPQPQEQQRQAALMPKKSAFGNPALQDQQEQPRESFDKAQDVREEPTQDAQEEPTQDAQEEQTQDAQEEQTQDVRDDSKQTMRENKSQGITKKPLQKKPSNRRANRQRWPGYVPPEDRMQLPSLVEGFIEYMHDEGKDTIKRDGDTSIRPDSKEYKELGYVKKLLWFLQQSDKKNRHISARQEEQYMRSKPGLKRFKAETHAEIVLDKKGNVIRVEILYPSGIQWFDDYFVLITKDASPFPPMPDFLNREEYSWTVRFYTEDNPFLNTLGLI